MASSLKLVIASFLIISFLLQLACAIHEEAVTITKATVGSSQVQNMSEYIITNGQTGSSTYDCGGACTARCRLSKRPNLCKRVCGTCCARCGCVPPGTYGKLGACPCYASLKTHGNKRKCP